MPGAAGAVPRGRVRVVDLTTAGLAKVRALRRVMRMNAVKIWKGCWIIELGSEKE